MKETTATNTGSNKPYSESSIASGWLCPRCQKINAPWVRQCDCSRSNWTITTSDQTYKPEWWKEYVTYCQETSSSTQLDSDTFKIHPESIVYTTSVNQIVGGSDYKDSVTGGWTNVPKTINTVKGEPT